MTLTREQLYEQVWTTLMRHLAKQYGLSDDQDGILEAVVDPQTPEVANRLLAVSFAPQLQGRVDELAANACEGTVTAEERKEYADQTGKADQLGIVKSWVLQVLAS